MIFSDKTKFSSNGLRDFRYHWSDFRKGTKYFSRRNFDNGSVMIFGSQYTINLVCEVENGRSEIPETTLG